MSDPVRILSQSIEDEKSKIAVRQLERLLTDALQRISTLEVKPGVNISLPIAQSDVVGLVAALASKVPVSRRVDTTTPLAGGGDLAADRTLSIIANGITDTLLRQGAALSVVGRSAGTPGNVADIVAVANGDILRVASGVLGFGAIPESSVTNLTTDLASKVPVTRTISTTAPLAGGGDLSVDRTHSINANGITDALLRQGAATSVIGRSAGTLGNVADIASTADGDVLRRASGVLGFGTIPSTSVTGLITSVVAGTNLSGGGSSGAVTLNVVNSPSFSGTLGVTGLATLTGGFTLGADSSANSHKITNLTNGSAAQDAAAFGQIGGAISVAVSGTVNTVAKFTNANSVGNSTITDTGSAVTIGSNTTINGLVTVNTANTDGIAVNATPSAGTANVHGIFVTQPGTINTTSGALNSFGVASVVTTSRSAGANNLTDYAFYADTTGGQAGYAYYGARGDNYLNATSGTTGIGTTPLSTYRAAVIGGVGVGNVKHTNPTDQTADLINVNIDLTSQRFGDFTTGGLTRNSTALKINNPSVRWSSGLVNETSILNNTGANIVVTGGVHGTNTGLAIDVSGNSTNKAINVTAGNSFVQALDAAGDFSVATNKLTCAAASGNTVITGTLAAGATSVSGTLGVTGLSTLTGGFSLGADSSAASHKITNLTNGSAAQDAAAFGQIATAVNAAVSGTTNTLPKFTGTNTIGNSSITDTGSLVTLSTYANLKGAPTIQTDSLTLGFTAPNGIIAAKNSSGAPASNIILYTNDGAASNAVLTLGFDKVATFAGAAAVTGNLSVNGNTTLGDANTDVTRVNGQLGVNDTPGAGYELTVLPSGGGTNTDVAFSSSDGKQLGFTVFSGSAAANITATNGLTITGSTTFNNNLSVNGNTTLGDASTDAHTLNGNITLANAPTAGTFKVGSANARILIAQQILTASSGTYTPTTGTKAVRLKIVGGGGGGAGAGGTTTGMGVGGGGWSGTYLEKWIDPAASVTGGAYTTGAAGAAGASGANNGGDGGDSTVIIQGTTYTAKGGAKGLTNTPGTGTTDTNISAYITGSSTGDFNVAGPPGRGFTIATSALMAPGCGGSNPLGGGGYAVNNVAGAAGTGYGAGGSGGSNYLTANRAGGAGTAGVIIIEEYA